MMVQCTLGEQVLDEYCQMLQTLINDAASLSHRVELRRRIEDDDATRRDYRLLRKRFHDNLNDLDHEVKQRGRDFVNDLEKVLEQAQELGLKIEVNDIDDFAAELFVLLEDPTRRGKYRSLVKYYKNNRKVVSFDILEQDFQHLPKPA